MQAVRHSILDVQSTTWHDEYHRFRTGVKELEIMIQNLINGIFATVTTVQEGVELLEVFVDMGKREVSSTKQPYSLLSTYPHIHSLTHSLSHTHTHTHSLSLSLSLSFISPIHTQTVKRVIDKQTVELFSMFTEELNKVKKEYSRQTCHLPPSQPSCAARATWARLLKRRIDQPMKVYIRCPL